MHRRFPLRVTAASAAALVAPTLAATTALASSGTGGSPARVRVANAQPAQVAGARSTGAPSSSQRVEVRLYLAGRDAAGAAKAVAAVSDPASPRYGRFLTPAQVRRAYAPSAATVRQARHFLTSYGLRVGEVPVNNAYVTATGSVAQVQKAFGTTLRTYRVSGRSLRAAASPATVPAALRGQVLAVSGLASVSSLMSTDHVSQERATRASRRASAARTSGTNAPPPDAFVNAGPCSAYYGEKKATTAPPAYGKVQPYAPCGYLPSQLQGAYGLKRAISRGFDGRGVTVAITDAYAAPTILADANTYASQHGQKPFTRNQFRQSLPSQPFRFGFDDKVNGDLCDERVWYGEETLDVEAVHSVAPGADVRYVASRSCDNPDFAEALNRVVSRHMADIVTNSWGGTDESNGSPELDAVYQQIFFQAALEGIGMYFSSGDSGDGAVDNNGVPTVQAPANSPLVTAVGGTALGVGRNDTRTFETGWSTSRSTLTNGAWSPTPPGDHLYGGGGGTSRVFSQPAYQRGVVPASIARRYSAAGGRAVPDVATLGDPNTG